MSGHHDQSSGSLAEASDALSGDGADVLSDVLRALRLTGSMFFLVDAATPWSTTAPRAEVFGPLVLPSAQHLISYHVVTDGACWAGLAAGPGFRLEAGDIFVVPHGDAYFLADPVDARHTGEQDVPADFFRRMAASDLPPVVRAGGGLRFESRFICGFLGCDRRPFNPILDALPALVRLPGAARADAPMGPLIGFALAELQRARPGRRDVLLRLSELMFIEVVRFYVETMTHRQTGWLAGLRDPVVGRALARLHADPARDWTLATLAAAAAASRSVLAERFTRIVGRPPMQYLACWRMQLATSLLASPAAKVRSVGESVGYESEAAFSRAFRKIVGVSPQDWRERHR